MTASVSRFPTPGTLFSPDLGVPEASHEMVVDHARGLHEGVADRRADEGEAAPLKVLAHCIGHIRPGRHLLVRLPRVLERDAPDKPPDEVVESPELPLDPEKRLG